MNTAEQKERRQLLKDALDAVERMQAKLEAAERVKHEPIAVIGIGCRFPGGVYSPEDYWRVLSDGVDAITEVPADRWTREEVRRLDPKGVDSMPTQHGGFLEEVDRFDAQFFGISPREAASMDPQQRIVLETCWEALERAGIPIDSLAGSQTGVFVGITTSDYAQVVREADPTNLDVYFATGNGHNATAGRVSFILGLRGPAVAVDTACSSSLVATHLACQSLRLGDSNLALAGGVNLILVPDPFVCFVKWGMMAPDGRCKAFDASANGFVRAEGCGILVLKRLTDAVADHDPILAVIAGSAVNQDGASGGLTVPNGLAQEAVIRQALAAARVEASQVSYVETHGTGTSLGDPIELEAIDAVLGPGRPADAPLVVSSVKTNIGHCESASGVAGLIKTVLCLQHGEIPPHLHFKELNPKINLRHAPVRIPVQAVQWKPTGGRRIAGVSSFGFSGTNAHVILSEAPPPSEPPLTAPNDRPAHVLALSAKSSPALCELAERYRRRIEEAPDLSLADLCYSSATTRKHHSHRAGLALTSREQAADALSALAAGRTAPRVAAGSVAAGRPKIAFLYTGQGAQYAGMGRELYETQEAFRQALDRCRALMSPVLGRDLLGVLYPEPGVSSPIDETAFTQPALFALEYALTEMWRSWGIEPAAVLGHSVGEFAAAVAAGALSVEDGARLIAARGRLMQSLPAGGAMAAAECGLPTVEAVLRRLGGRVSVAALNAPDATVISGPADDVQAASSALEDAGVKCQRLVVSHAFHSPLMEPVLAAFENEASRAAFAPTVIEFASNLHGRVLGPDEATDAEYWRRHLREPVRFADGFRALRESGCRVFIEIGPGSTLLGLGRRNDGDEALAWLPSLKKGRGDWEQVADTLARLYVTGVPIDWRGVYRHAAARTVALPTYPFQRERYWPPQAADAQYIRRTSGHPLLGSRLSSPRLRDVVFEQHLAANAPASLNGHRVFDHVVVPAAAYLEMATAAARAALGPGGHEIRNLQVHEPLVLDEGHARTVQTCLGAMNSGAHRVEIHSWEASADGADARWTLHASGLVEAARPASGRTDGAAGGDESAWVVVDPTDYYARLASAGLNYGAAYRGITSLRRGDGRAEATVTIRPEIVHEVAAYALHPALLDAAFHVVGIALPDGLDPSASDHVYLPVQVGTYRAGAPAAGEIRVEARTEAAGESGEVIVGHVTMTNPAGEVVAEVEGLRCKRASRAVFESRIGTIDGWFHEVQWEALPDLPHAEATASGCWVLLCDACGVGSALVRALVSRGAECVCVRPAESYSPPRDGHAGVRAGSRDDVAALLGALKDRPVAGVVHLWNLDCGSKRDEKDLHAHRETGIASLLHLAQEMASDPRPGRFLTIVTAGAQAPDGAVAHPAGVFQSPALGLGRVIASEHPELQVVLLDIDPATSTTEGAAEVLRELDSPNRDETQVAVRGSRRFAPRLLRQTPVSHPFVLPSEHHGLESGQQGDLDSLELRSIDDSPPATGEIRVRVETSGLNFRDVLNALGMYPGDAVPLGGEVVGVVEAVGPGATRFTVGDPVLALTPRAFCSAVNTSEKLAVRRPADMSVIEAATIPIVFLTAVYALTHLGRMSAGERLLVHAGAGGVGLAAIQLAQNAGAEVFATAGTPGKRAFLRKLGVEHVMDSRSAAFGDEIDEITGGQGLDIILNSLAGEFIPRSLRLLRKGGRFLELGKTDLWDEARAAAVNPLASYQAVYLGDACERNPDLVQSMFADLMSAFARGDLKPLPARIYQIDKATDAFRFMAQARHIGKITIEHLPTASRLLVRGDGVYLVTGAFGGLGVEVVRWLAKAGARHLALISRQPPAGPAADLVRELVDQGVRVTVRAIDVADLEALQALVTTVETSGAKLRGIVHAAGVIDDATLLHQDWERFERVLRPKVDGAWNLHLLADDRDLDFFVLFSAGAGLFGSPGQGSYAAGNAFLDALAWHRHAARHRAVSIAWGAWEGPGMASRVGAHGRARWVEQGLGFIEPARGVAALERAIRHDMTQVAVMPVDWNRFLSRLGSGQRPALLRQLDAGRAAARSEKGGPEALLRSLLDAPAAERPALLEARVRDEVSRVLGVPAGAVAADRDLMDLGMDSLMAVELANRLRTLLQVEMPTTLPFEQPSVAALSAALLERLPAGEAPADGGGDSERQALLKSVEGLSDSDVDALLKDLLPGR